MFLSSIEVSNFRKHKNTKLDFDKINVLVGKNGSGKTSILQAICWALYGSVTTKAKKSDLLRHGAKEGSVVLNFDSDFTVYRNFKGTVSGYETSTQNVLFSKDGELKDWLNISRETFFNIIYGAQNEMCSFFQAFNAKEKDFIDDIIIPNNPCEKILSIMDVTKKYLSDSIISQKTTLTHRQQAEKYKISLLEANNLKSLSDITDKISDINNKLNSLKNIEYIISLKDKISKLNNTIEVQKQNIKSEEARFINIESELKNKINILKEISDTVKAEFNIEDINNFQVEINKRYDIKENINKMLSILQNPEMKDPKHHESMLEFVIKGLNFILSIDEFKNKAYTLLNKYSNEVNNYNYLSKSKESYSENVARIKTSVDNLNVEIQTAITEFNNLTKNKDVNLIIEEFNNLKMEYQKYTMLYNNLMSYENVLSNMSIVNESEILEYDNIINTISSYRKIFDRDGFMSYIRTHMLLEIANKTDSFLKNFGFDDLFPVKVSNGELMFNGKQFSLLSGGQQMITAIILRIIFARIIAPGMKWSTIILDEPTTGVDEYRIPILKDYFTELSSKLSLQLFIITHHDGVIPENANVIHL